MTARTAALVAALVMAVGSAGCTTPGEQPDPPPSTSAQPAPEDREVLPTLRRIDLCEVLDAAMTATSVLPAGARPRARQPFACVVEGLPDPVSARVVSLTHKTRLSLPARAIGGAKAYVRGDRGACTVYLPVSFELAVELSRRTDEAEPCRTVAELAAASVTVLADPDAARVDPRWDACTALAEALEPDRSELVGNELDDCADLSDPARRMASISFAAGPPPTGRPRTATVGGTPVQVYEGDRTCEVHWRQKPLTSRFAPAPDYPVLLTTLDCARSTALAESVMKVLAEPAPAGGEARSPMFYAPDEPDSPLPGACAHVEGVSAPGRCEPYREVPVPDDVTDAMHDANAMCAVSAEVVGEHFGSRLRPAAVTDAGIDDCYFAEPERTIQVEFAVKAGPARPEPGDREVTIAGRPGFVTAGGGHYRYRLSTSSAADGDAADGDPTVELRVRTGPVASAATTLPAGTDRKAEAVLADVLREHFP